MNYFQKNKKNIIIAIISVLLLATLIALWLTSRNTVEVNAKVTPDRLQVGDTLRFEDNSSNTESVVWDFNDGTISKSKKGIHVFSTAGMYSIKVTVNKKFKKEFSVLVSPRENSQTTASVDARISAPSQVMALESVLFSAFPNNAKSYEWNFGVNPGVDSNENSPTYTYKKAGSYLVTLTVVDENNHRQQVTHSIIINSNYNPMDQAPLPAAAPVVDDSYELANDDIKKVLQQIALGNNFNEYYNYLLKTYMCKNDDVAIVVNNKTTSFYSYCMDLQHKQNNIVIQEVKTNYDSTKRCVVKLDITQSK